jgi:chitinase
MATSCNRYSDTPLPVPCDACAAYVNVVMLSFAKPDCTYSKGSLSFAGTGLEFTAAGSTVKAAVAALKAANSNTRVLLSVGGGGYKNWQAMNARCLQDIVDDFALDGTHISECIINCSCWFDALCFA